MHLLILFSTTHLHRIKLCKHRNRALKCIENQFEMQVINTAPPGHDKDELQESLTKAAAAGESLLQRAGSGTGEALRANFLLVSETVEAQDSHLLQEQEHSFLRSFRVSHLNMAGLHARMKALRAQMTLSDLFRK